MTIAAAPAETPWLMHEPTSVGVPLPSQIWVVAPSSASASVSAAPVTLNCADCRVIGT